MEEGFAVWDFGNQCQMLGIYSTPRLGKPGYFDGWNDSEASKLKDK